RAAGERHGAGRDRTSCLAAVYRRPDAAPCSCAAGGMDPAGREPGEDREDRMMDTAKLLMRLSAAAAPSGLEGHALLREILTGELGIAEEKIRADRNGNLLAEICPGQPGGRHIMLDA